MTLNEAIGIKYEMRDVKTGEEVSISERCRRAIEFLGGLDEVAKLIPVSRGNSAGEAEGGPPPQ